MSTTPRPRHPLPRVASPPAPRVASPPAPRVASPPAPPARPPAARTTSPPTSPLGLLIDSAGRMAGLGMFRDSRTVLMTALQITLRSRFMDHAGRDAADSKPTDYARRLRSAKLIDKRTLRAVVEISAEQPPYDQEFVTRLADVVRRTIASLRTKGGVS